MNKLVAIIKREYLQKVRTKFFVIMTVLDARQLDEVSLWTMNAPLDAPRIDLTTLTYPEHDRNTPFEIRQEPSLRTTLIPSIFFPIDWPLRDTNSIVSQHQAMKPIVGSQLPMPLITIGLKWPFTTIGRPLMPIPMTSGM